MWELLQAGSSASVQSQFIQHIQVIQAEEISCKSAIVHQQLIVNLVVALAESELTLSRGLRTLYKQKDKILKFKCFINLFLKQEQKNAQPKTKKGAGVCLKEFMHQNLLGQSFTYFFLSYCVKHSRVHRYCTETFFSCSRHLAQLFVTFYFINRVIVEDFNICYSRSQPNGFISIKGLLLHISLEMVYTPFCLKRINSVCNLCFWRD